MEYEWRNMLSKLLLLVQGKSGKFQSKFPSMCITKRTNKEKVSMSGFKWSKGKSRHQFQAHSTEIKTEISMNVLLGITQG